MILASELALSALGHLDQYRYRRACVTLEKHINKGDEAAIQETKVFISALINKAIVKETKNMRELEQSIDRLSKEKVRLHQRALIVMNRLDTFIPALEESKRVLALLNEGSNNE